MIFRLYHSEKGVQARLLETVRSRPGLVLATTVVGSRDLPLEERPPLRQILDCAGGLLDLALVVDEGRPEGMWRDPMGELCEALWADRKEAARAAAGYALARGGAGLAWFRKSTWDPLEDAEEITAHLAKLTSGGVAAFVRPGPRRERPPKRQPPADQAADPAPPPRHPASPDPWNVLGVARGASLEEVRKAWRARLAQYHPDKVAHLAPEFAELAERRTRELNDAFARIEREFAG